MRPRERGFGDLDDGSDIDPESVIRDALEEAAAHDFQEPDEISEEDVSLGVVVNDQELEGLGNKYIDPFLADRIAERASRVLGLIGLGGADHLDGEKFKELCNVTGLSPETDKALGAVEDLFFYIYDRDYLARNLGDPITIDDLEEAGAEFEGVAEFNQFQDELNIEAYSHIREFVEDPIIDLPLLQDRKKELVKKREEATGKF